jgi:hypothetical protein
MKKFCSRVRLAKAICKAISKSRMRFAKRATYMAFIETMICLANSSVYPQTAV